MTTDHTYQLCVVLSYLSGSDILKNITIFCKQTNVMF